jgi:hypothetical protein
MMQNFLFWLQAFASSVRNPLLCRLLTSAQSLHALLREALPSENGRKVGQISPGKNMIFPCTTAVFTIPNVLQTGLVMSCSLTQGFCLICGFCPSARRFALRLLSDGRSPSRPCHWLVLFKVDSWSPFWNMYRGLTPHKIIPTPGTHNYLHSVSKKLRSFLAMLFTAGNVRREAATVAKKEPEMTTLEV